MVLATLGVLGEHLAISLPMISSALILALLAAIILKTPSVDQRERNSLRARLISPAMLPETAPVALVRSPGMLSAPMSSRASPPDRQLPAIFHRLTDDARAGC